MKAHWGFMLPLLLWVAAFGCKPAPAPDRYRVPLLGSYARGDASALVTVVELSDFQCPQCGRANALLSRLRSELGDRQLRIVWKDNPLPRDGNAGAAAEAARAAGAQGKFWPMHDLLFAHQQALYPEQLIDYARQLDLDVESFRRSISQHEFVNEIADDLHDVQRLGVKSAPALFINGRPLQRVPEYTELERIVMEEREAAARLLARSKGPIDVYATLTAGAREAAPNAPVAAAVRVLDTDARYRIEEAGAPSRGAPDARVSVIVWSDFQCEHCARWSATLDRLARDNRDVRLVFKNRPLEFHAMAHLAAEAATAAKLQGRFWPMHDALMKHWSTLSRRTLEDLAREVGLDMPAFDAALAGATARAVVDADVKQAKSLGIDETPISFVNGLPLVGEVSDGELSKMVARARGDADALLHQGVPLTEVYGRLVANARAEAPLADADDPIESTVYDVDTSNAFSRGPADAPITIVEFADFQCPACGRVDQTLRQLEERYPGKIRFVWKDYPLAKHPFAMAAAEAARAAGEQGRFWEMHDKLLAEQGPPDRATIDGYARELGLDLDRFYKALDGGLESARVAADRRQGDSLAGSDPRLYTPTFFVNGRKMVGAYPRYSFQALIDELLSAHRS